MTETVRDTRIDFGALILAIVLFVAATSFILGHKVGFDADEFASLFRANSVFDEPFVEYETTYAPVSELFTRNFAVTPGHEFDFHNVWLNETINVHPPLYFYLLHFLCSFWPGRIAIGCLVAINIAFTVLTLIASLALLRRTISNVWVRGAALLALALCAGTMNANAFLRMYCMAMLWCVLLCFLLVDRVGREERPRLFFVRIAAVLFAGAMTHYYCLIYFFFMLLAFAIWLVFRRNWSEIGKGLVAVAVAAIASICFYPPMLYHITGSYRATEAVDNLVSHSSVRKHLSYFAHTTNDELFGGLVALLAVLAIILLVAAFLRKKDATSASDVDALSPLNIVLMTVPALLYFMVIVVIAPYYHMNRYLYPIYAIAVCAYATLFWTLARHALGRRIATVALCTLLAITTCSSWFASSWQVLFRHNVDDIETAVAWSGTDCVCLANKTSPEIMWDILPLTQELELMGSLRALQPGDESSLSLYSGCDRLVLVANSISYSEDDIAALAQEYDLPSNVVFVSTAFRSKAYYLDSDVSAEPDGVNEAQR